MTTQAPADRAAIAVGRPPRIVPRHPDERMTMNADPNRDLRDDLLHALDHAYVVGPLGFDTPEALLAAYDAECAVRVPPPADQTGLRQRIADALAARFTADGDLSQGMRVIDPDDEDDPEPARWVRPGEAADAVLAVLPEQTDRTALLLRAADFVGGLLLTRTSITAAELEAELRRVAAEEQPAETQGGFELRGTAEIEATALDDAATALDAQTCTCGCRRGAEFLRQRSAVIRATPEQPAVGEQPETQETRPCGNEHPGSGFALGVRCTLEEHSGDHGRDEEIPGTGHTVRLRWPNRERP